MAEFERVRRCPDAIIPTRGTNMSAGYDLIVAEDKVVLPYEDLVGELRVEALRRVWKRDPHMTVANAMVEKNIESHRPLTLAEMADLTKAAKAKPTLVSVGVKCRMAPDQFLDIRVRSSTPLKYWLIVANAPGTIDADYYNNPDNEGEIFVQLINLSPFPIQLKKGDCVAQGILRRYETTESDVGEGKRIGGFGSTNE